MSIYIRNAIGNMDDSIKLKIYNNYVEHSNQSELKVRDISEFKQSKKDNLKWFNSNEKYFVRKGRYVISADNYRLLTQIDDLDIWKWIYDTENHLDIPELKQLFDPDEVYIDISELGNMEHLGITRKEIRSGDVMSIVEFTILMWKNEGYFISKRDLKMFLERGYVYIGSDSQRMYTEIVDDNCIKVKRIEGKPKVRW